MPIAAARTGIGCDENESTLLTNPHNIHHSQITAVVARFAKTAYALDTKE